MGKLGSTSSASLDFTDGDTAKRFTITDAMVEATSQLHVSIHRIQVADVDDYGWVFVANVLQVRSGSFDVKVVALAEDAIAAAGEFPNETVALSYLID